jgi:hypothetical protein
LLLLSPLSVPAVIRSAAKNLLLLLRSPLSVLAVILSAAKDPDESGIAQAACTFLPQLCLSSLHNPIPRH